jgi:colanic acid/amylovoran biosynthesis protein
MNIVIENTVCLNTGDAAIMLAIRKVLQEAFGDGVSLTVFDSDPAACSRLYRNHLYPDVTFKPLMSEALFRSVTGRNPLKRFLNHLYNKNLWKDLQHVEGKYRHDGDLRHYRDADLIITTGGTYLVENYSLDARLRQFKIDRLFGKSPIFYTQSLGPFMREKNRTGLKPVFDSSPLILLRDERSREHIEGIVDDLSKVHVVADSVFALADVGYARKIATEGYPSKHPADVAISVRQWSYFDSRDTGGMESYKQSIAALTTWLVEAKGADVTFLSSCQGVPEYRYDDSAVARTIVEMLPAQVRSKVKVDGDHHRPEELMNLLKGFDLVVATRMHIMIMALCMGTPVLPIAYEFKTRELAKRLDLEAFVSDINTISRQDLIGKADALIRTLDVVHPQTMRAVIEEYDSAMSVVALLKDVKAGGT